MKRPALTAGACTFCTVRTCRVIAGETVRQVITSKETVTADFSSLGDLMFLSARRRYARSAAISGLSLLALIAPNLMAQSNRLGGPIRSQERIALAGHTRPQL